MKKKLITFLFQFAVRRFLILHGWKPKFRAIMLPSGPALRPVWEKEINVLARLETGKPGVTTVTVGTAEAIRRALGEGQFIS